MPGYAALLGLLAVFGVVTSVFDVAINTEAAQLELRSGQPLMSGMHGMFSLGGMVGRRDRRRGARRRHGAAACT